MTPLDPELLAHSEPINKWLGNSVPAGTRLIIHPLLYDYVVRPGDEGQANKSLAEALIRLAEKEKQGAWEEAIMEHEPGSRLAALVRYEPRLTDKEYWRLVSVVWTNYPYTSRTQLQEWILIFDSSRAHRSAMMGEQEQATLSELPPLVPIFRGFDYPNGQYGWSWTRDREVACRFARDGVNEGTRMVAEGQVERDSIIALLLRTGEDEVIVNIDRVEIGRICLV